MKDDFRNGAVDNDVVHLRGSGLLYATRPWRCATSTATAAAISARSTAPRHSIPILAARANVRRPRSASCSGSVDRPMGTMIRMATGSGLHIAARNPALLKHLLATKGGAQVNGVDPDGQTPLHRAVDPSHFFDHTLTNAGIVRIHQEMPDAVRLLLEAGADPNAADRNGRTPLHVIANLPRRKRVGTAHTSFVQGFKAVNGMRGRRVTSYDLVLTHEKLLGCRFDVIRQLVEAGADPNRRDRRGDTPIALAQKQTEDKDIVRYLQTASSPSTGSPT